MDLYSHLDFGAKFCDDALANYVIALKPLKTTTTTDQQSNR